jgi:hypothetical protein
LIVRPSSSTATKRTECDESPTTEAPSFLNSGADLLSTCVMMQVSDNAPKVTSRGNISPGRCRTFSSTLVAQWFASSSDDVDQHAYSIRLSDSEYSVQTPYVPQLRPFHRRGNCAFGGKIVGSECRATIGGDTSLSERHHLRIFLMISYHRAVVSPM